MSGVDSRIVTMKFDNVAFERGVSTTTTSLGKLKDSLNFSGAGASSTTALGTLQSALSKIAGLNPFKSATTGMGDLTTKSSIFSRLNPFKSASTGVADLSQKTSIFSRLNPFKTAEAGAADLQSATSKFSVSSMTGGIDSVSKSFIALSTVAITVLSQITTAAFTAGTQMAKSLTVDPIKTGLSEYETNLNSIQTILANTEVSGATLEDVNKALDELNTYSDKTIYNFSEMARNIGTFTAAGVGLDESVMSIKGIANLAALSGSNSQQAATAMYQLSQEIAAGRVSLMGWNSVVNAGMGGSTFQRALAQTAVAMGELDESAVKLEGEMKNVVVNGSSFRDSIMAKPGEVSWLSKDVLTGTLAQFTGDLKKADIMAQGFNENQAESIMATARTAMSAAQDVKTLSGVFDVAKETAASGWARTWQLIFGDFEEAKSLFTDFSNAFSGMIAGAAEQRNALLEGWDKLGGREVLIEGISNAFKALFDVLEPIKEAFRDIFPAQTAQGLFDLTERFAAFTKSLQISDETADGLRRTFRGVFAAFSIVGEVIGGVIDVISGLIGSIGDGSDGILDFTGGIADFIVSLEDAIKKGGALEGFFDGLEKVLEIPIKVLGIVGDLIAGLFTGFDEGDADKVTGAIDGVKDRLAPLEEVGERIKNVFDKIGDVLSTIGDVIGDALGKVGDAIAGAFTDQTFDRTLDVINTALLGGIVLLIKKFFDNGISVDMTGGLFDSIKEGFGAVTEAMQNMQAGVKADVILKIAAALAILTASIVVLSMIDSAKLAKALGAMGVAFVGLQVGMTTLMTAMLAIGVFKIMAVSVAVVAFASAMLILSGALKVLASMSPLELVKGLVGFAGALGILVLAAQPLGAAAPGLIRAGVGITIIAGAMVIMAAALKLFATMSWTEMGKGLAGVAGALVILAGAMRLMPRGMVLQAGAITILAVALNVLAIAVKQFGNMDLVTMAKGMGGIAVALLLIAGAMSLMPPNMLLQAAALVAVSVALNLMAVALQNMGGMSWEEIAKGLVALGGGLLVLAGGLTLMSGTLGGSAALLAASVALGIFVPILIVLGNLSWGTIIKGLAAVALAFGVFGVAGLLLAPVTPILVALAAAMVLFGGALALAGIGARQFARAFEIVVQNGTKGVEVLEKALNVIIKAIPKAIKAFGQGIVEFVKVIGKSIPAFARAFKDILISFLDVIIQVTPKIGSAFLAIVKTALRVVRESVPDFVDTGFTILMAFLRGIERNIGSITRTAADIVVKFLTGLADRLPRIIDAGFKLIIAFINGLADAIDENGDELRTAGWNLATAIINGMIDSLKNGASYVKDWAVHVASEALTGAMDFLGIFSPSREFMKVGQYSDEGFAEGLKKYSGKVGDASRDVAKNALDTISYSMRGISDAFSGDVDIQPTIVPVLDLTQVAKDATQIGGMLATKPISTGVSYDRASSISADRQAALDAQATGDTTPVTQEFKFEQHNHSPKELSAAEIYRNTKNLLALERQKEGLA